MGKIGIVVVTYNRLALLKENIQSLREQDYLNREIIVVNNGSTDGTSKWLDQQEDLIVINQSNSGGAGGFFTGLKYVAENEFDYCWCMDDDVICSFNALSELINAAQKLGNYEWGFLCSSVFDKKGNPTNIPDVDIRRADGYADWTFFLNEGLVKVRFSSFVSVFIPTKNIIKYGLPLKDFFIWGDDTEYTTRLSDNLPCYLVGKSIVKHMREMTQGLSFLNETNPNRLKLYFYMYRNQYYLAKNGYWHKPFPRLRFFFTKGILFFKALLKFKIRHVLILIKALWKAPMFKTKIEYPALK